MALILIIEDEVLLRESLVEALDDCGHEVSVAESGAAARELLETCRPDMVLLDLRLPDASGLELLSEIRDHDPSTRIVLMTAYGSVNDAVEAMRRGAVDYLQKPLDLDELRLLVNRVLRGQRQERELDYHRRRITLDGVVGKDPRLLQILDNVQRLSDANLRPRERPAILLTGETGTGKGVIARAIHKILGDGPLIEVNCSAMPATLIEAELFGYERGTFTDARNTRTGLFEAAENGMIFLDEIGSLEFPLQAKFLKVVEEKRIRRLGSNHDRPVDVQVIAATNRDLVAAVQAGAFREDLLHRLEVLAFEIPPLRDRVDDILELARHFCGAFSKRYGNRERFLSSDTEALFLDYAWPGNVRELSNVIERAVLVEPSETLEPAAFASLEVPRDPEISGPMTLPPGGVDLVEVERSLIRQALEQTDGNRTQAADLLGLTRDTLRYRVEKFDLG